MANRHRPGRHVARLMTIGVAVTIAAAETAHAQVPPEIARQLAAIGRGVCGPQTAQLYRPLHPNPSYQGVSIARDISFGPDPRNVLDVFAPETGGSSRPVLIFVSGGAGNRQSVVPEGDPFYDNVLLWAVKNGMVGVNMQRRPGQAWDDPARDVALVVQWVGQSIARYAGNPGRVFIWAHSAGNVPVSTYIGHAELWGPRGVGVNGVVFMSAGGFDILPAAPPQVRGGVAPCGQPAASAAIATTEASGADGFWQGSDGRYPIGSIQPAGPRTLAGCHSSSRLQNSILPASSRFPRR